MHLCSTRRGTATCRRSVWRRRARAPPLRDARAALEEAGVMVEGRVVATADGGRTLRASAFWLRAV
jgi:hypothetical protein